MAIKDDSQYPVLTQLINEVQTLHNGAPKNEEERIEAENIRKQNEEARIQRIEELKNVNAVQFDSRLASAESQLNESTNKFKTASKSTKKLFVTLMDDDGRTEFLTQVKPILIEYGIKMSLAINCGLVGQSGYMTWNDIKQLESEGYEILNHTIGSDGKEIANKTLEQLKIDYETEKAAFIAHDLDTYDYMVYSGTMPWQDIDTRNKINQIYKCCFANTDAPYNYLPFDNYAVHRGALTYNPTATIDQYVDMGECYLVLFGHAWMYDSTALQTLRTALDYLIAKGFTFVTAKEMVDNYSNVINLGNLGEDGFLLDKNGNVNFTLNGININKLTNVFYGTSNFNGKDITEYRKNSITIEKVGSSYANWGLPQSGTVRTYRFDDDRFSFQEFSQLGTVDLWKRYYDNTNKTWANLGYFSPVSGVSVSTANRPKFIKRGITIFDYTINKPITARGDGYGIAYNTVARSTAYSVGDIVYASTVAGGANNRLHKCIVSGTTSDTKPEYAQTLNGITIDGTAQFQYFGDKVIYVDGTGTTV